MSDFYKAGELDPGVQDDSHFRVWLIRARRGEPAAATKELQTYLENREAGTPDDWPSKIARFLTGELAEADFFKAAGDMDKQKDAGQHCKAFFYAGSKRLIQGNPATGRDYFEKCLATDEKTLPEYRSAAAELKYLKAANQP